MTTEIRTSAGSDRVPRRATLGRVATEVLLLALAPPAAWYVFGLTLINQDQFVDPWFYLGYGRQFVALFENFGWTYYGVRFPVVMLNDAAAWTDPVHGYAALRYVLVLLCGVPLYLWARVRLGGPAAALAYLFLLCNPLLPRILLWDLTTFVSVPAALAGMGLWLLSDRPLVRFASGFALMAAVASHAFTATAVGTFLIVQGVWRLRTGQLRALALRDVLATACGALFCFGLGYAYYVWHLGVFDPTVLVQTTLTAVQAGHTYAGVHSTPFSTWSAREYHTYVPLLCLAIGGVLLGRRLRAPSTDASVWWFGLCYTGVYLVYQFVFGRFVLETFYYFAHLTLVVFLLVPLIVSELTNRLRPGARLAAGIAGAAALVAVPIAEDLWPVEAGRLLTIPYDNPAALAGLLPIAAGIVALAAVAAVARRPVLSAGVLAAFLVLAQILVFLNPTHRRVFDATHRAREAGVYRAGAQLIDLFATLSTAKEPAMLWYCSSQYSVGSVVSTVLLFTLHAVETDYGCLARIGDYERGRLDLARYVLIVDEDRGAIAARTAALREAGYRVAPRRSLTLGDDTYRAELLVVEILRTAS